MKAFFLIICFAVSAFVNAQITTTSVWAWMKGDNTAGTYGSKGVAADANQPGSRDESISWTDKSGDLWLFGGRGYTALNSYLNDLWKYNVSTNQWTWMKGDNTENVAGVYGSAGVSDPANKPGNRAGSVSWTDLNGNLWLFGGESFNTGLNNNYYNDLWKYDPLTNQWTWINGNNLPNFTGYYTTQGGYGVPGARQGSVSWTDQSGNLWLFGGQGFGSTSSYGYLNDLWKYDITSNQWTWEDGANIINSYGIYNGGTGVVKPGARQYSVSWTDQSGNLWLFGGDGYTESNLGYLSDLWKYDPVFGGWTFVNGVSSTNPNLYGFYGTQGVTHGSPGGRKKSISWTDLFGNLWLFGGDGYSASNSGYLNDLWKYNISINQWTWMKGDNTAFAPNVYGTQGIAAQANKAGAREGSVSWVNDGNLWLFGGSNLGDLWKLSNAFTFTGNGNWNTASNWVDNLVGPTNVPDGIEVIINPSGQCTQTGDITTQPLGKVMVRTGKTLNLNGNLNNAGSMEGPGILNLSGGVSALASTGKITTSMVLSNKQVSLTYDLTAGAISLTNGSVLDIGNYNLNMNSFALTGDSANFITTSGFGTVSRRVGGTPVVYPVGLNNSSYTPVTVTNTGPTDTFGVRVLQGIQTNTPVSNVGTVITNGAVNRTWLITAKDITGVSKINLTVQWSLADEQPGFDRAVSYISHFQVCPPPINCSTGFYDAVQQTAASGPPQGPFTLTRNNITSFNSPQFIVSSLPIVYNFIGTNTNWSDSRNWTNENVPPLVNSQTTISKNQEIIVDAPTVQCIYNGSIIIKPGGKLTVNGKGLKVTGSIIEQ